MNQIEIKRTVNLDGTITTETLPGALYYAENQAHKFVIAAKRGEADVALSGTVFGSFVRHGDGQTVPLTGGEIENGCAAITLISNCYLVPGRFDLAVYVTEGGVTTMVYACTGHVRATETGEAVDPSGEVALNVAQLIADIEAARATIPQDYSAMSREVADARIGADNTTYQSVGAAIRGQAGELKTAISAIAKYVHTGVTESWSQIQANVRAGLGPLFYDIGDEMVTNYAMGENVYEMPWIVVQNDIEVEWADGTKHPGLVLQSKYATIEWIQFDAPEENIVNLTEEPNALDGWYYWGKTGTTYTKLTVSTGGALPTTYDNIVKSSIDNLYVVQYGYNRWRDSAYRQWLNSDADAGHWWTAQHPGDKEPAQHATRDGFIKGLDSDFLACINPIKVNTACNTVTDGGVTDTTVDKFFLPSIEEIYGVPQAAGVEGDYWPYWKTITGLTEPSNAVNDARKIPALNDKTGDAANQRLRSANRSYVSNVWAGSTGGSLVGSYAASGAYRACPACVIS